MKTIDKLNTYIAMAIATARFVAYIIAWQLKYAIWRLRWWRLERKRLEVREIKSVRWQ